MNPRTRATILGGVALLLWSTSNALTRTLVTQLGPFTLLACGFGIGGLLLFGIEAGRQRSLTAPFKLSPRYLLACGPFFLLYCFAYAFAYHLAPDDATALVLGLVNYLWPALLLVFSVAFFPSRPRWLLLVPGLVVGFLGVGVAANPAGLVEAADAFLKCPLGFVVMFVAAVAWGLYSNLSRRFGDPSTANGVWLLAGITGLVFWGARTATGEESRWTPDTVLPLVWTSVFLCGAGYSLWDEAVRRGDLVLLGALSYGVPVAATVFAAAWFGEPLTVGLLVGSVLVVAGAVLCRVGLRTPEITAAARVGNP